MTPDPFKSQLQTDAAQTAPAFSPLLHERIMAHLRAQKPSAKTAAAPIRRRSLWPYAIAASLSIIATIAFNVLLPTPHPKPTIADLPTPSQITAPVNTIFTDAVKPAADSFDQAKLANLDQDAQRLMFFIADQLPGPPAAAEKNNPQ